MTGPIPESWVEGFSDEPVPSWLALFHADPDNAVDGLLTGRLHLGHLNVAERDLLLADWVERLGDLEQFRQRLDDALARWIRRYWGKLDYLRPASLADTWQRAANAIAFAAPHLSGAARELRDHFGERQSFLGVLSVAPSRDPLGRFLAALAANQSDDKLASFWDWTCDLPQGVPLYHARYALEGVAGLPTESAERCTVIGGGLLRIGRALHRHVLAEIIEEKDAVQEWKTLAYWCQTAFPFQARWQEFAARKAAALAEPLPAPLLAWVREVFDVQEQPAAELDQKTAKGQGARVLIQKWILRAKEIRRRFSTDFPAALAEAKQLLEEERAVRDASLLVRPLCNFATGVMHGDAKLALTWAREAHDVDPRDPYTWTTFAEVLFAARQTAEAEAKAREAHERFPRNVIAQTCYAKILQRNGNAEAAESVYRVTIQYFPDDVVARAGLADVLKGLNRLDEAEAVYRETIELFPHNDVARNGLADVLKGLDRLEEAEAVYRETIELFPHDDVARNGLADVLKGLGRLEEAEAAYRETTELFPLDAVSRSGLADVLKSLGRLEEAEAGYRGTIDLFSHDQRQVVVAHTGLASVLRAVGRFQEALEEADCALALEPSNVFALAERKRILRGESGQPPSQKARPLPQMKSAASLVTGPMSHTKRRALLNHVVWLRLQASAGKDSETENAQPDDLRSRAAEILKAILKQHPDDERTLAQRCLLRLDTGDLDGTVQQVEEALRIRPNAQLLLTLRARVDRLRARRDQERLQPGVDPRVLEAPRRLRHLRPELRPVVLLQQGLGYLALTDGELRKEKVVDEFGKLHRWIEHRLDPRARDAAREKTDEEDDDLSFSGREAGVDADFNRWWGEELKRTVFGLVTEAGAPKLADVPRLAAVLEDQNQLVEKLEDFYVGRLAARAEWDPTEPVAV